MASIHGVAGQAKSATERTASNPWLELLERAGYVVRGVLYVVMGGLALALALGIGGTATDPTGTLVILTRFPAGKVFLVAVVIGLGASAIWGFVRVIFAMKLLVGSASAKSHDSLQANIAQVLSYPAGKWIALALGLITVGVGIAQFVEAYRAISKHDLKRAEMTEAERKVVDTLGRLGMIARGITFTLVGWFVIQGALHRDPSKVHGYGGAFLFLLGQPFGRLMLGVVALGFIALGLHSFACARWVRLMGSTSS